VTGQLEGQRVVLTEADTYMGPAVLVLFREEGAEVLADTPDLRLFGAGARLIEEAGHVDVLVANMAPTIEHLGPAESVTDEVWHYMFDRLVTPLYDMCSAVLPQMIDVSVARSSSMAASAACAISVMPQPMRRRGPRRWAMFDRSLAKQRSTTCRST